MSLGPKHAALEKLQAAKKECYKKLQLAQHRLERESHFEARRVVGPLAELRDQVLFRKPSAPPVEERVAAERKLTIALCKEIIKSDALVFFPLANSDNLRITDTSIDAEKKIANYAHVAARKAVLDYEEQNADALKQEIADEEMREIREALKGNDPAKARAVLAGTI